MKRRRLAQELGWMVAYAVPLSILGTVAANLQSAPAGSPNVGAARARPVVPEAATPTSPRPAKTGAPLSEVLASAPPQPGSAPVDPVELATFEPTREDPCSASELPAVEASTVAERFFGDTSRPVVALTFDDGPSRENTPRILEVLARYEVPATFFVLGRRAEAMPDLLTDIVQDGHELANHGFSHTSLRSLWKSQIRDEVCRTSAAIEGQTGLRPALFRPPFGRYAPSAIPLVGGLNMSFVLWSVDSHDWELDDPQVIASKVIDAAHPGSIVLLHDRESVTVHALPAIITGLRQRGFELVTVSNATGLDAYVDSSAASSVDGT